MSNQYLDQEGLRILNEEINDRREADLNNLADTYDNTLTYKVGDLVIHDYKLWKCKTAISTAEAWNESKWEQINLEQILQEKYVKIFNSSDFHYPPTYEEMLIIAEGVFIKGAYGGVENPVCLPGVWGTEGTSVIYTSGYIGKTLTGIGSLGMIQFRFNGETHAYISGNFSNQPVFQLYNYGWPGTALFAKIVETDNFKLKELYFPNYPSTADNSILQLNPNKASLSWVPYVNNVAPEYDATATYAVGDVCIHDGALYQCTMAIATAEAWDATHWTQVKVDDVYADKNYFGFRRIPAPASTTLTDDEIAALQSGCVLDGNFLGFKSPVVLPSPQSSGTGRLVEGFILGYQNGGLELVIRHIYLTSDKVIHLDINDVFKLTNTSLFIKGKQYPNYPSDVTKEYVLTQTAATNGSLAWQEKKYGPSISDNTITELTYEKISVLSLSADKTFTLKAAQTDCIPEYKALITNSGSSAITLTFTGVGTIHTNDPNIVLVAGTNSTATIPANTKVEVNIFDGDVIVYNKNAISYATNAEVEALF